MNSKLKQYLILGAGAVVVVILFVIGSLVQPQANRQPATAPNQTVNQQPRYTNFDQLGYLGVSELQMRGFKLALSRYASSKNVKPASYVINNAESEPLDPNTRLAVSKAQLNIDKLGSFTVRLEQPIQNQVRVYLYEQPNGNQVYDSGLLTIDY